MSAIAPKERPILFSGLMVLALLSGRKTQTRRIVKMKKYPEHDALTAPQWVEPGESIWINPSDPVGGGVVSRFCPYGAPGNRMWVRETWCPRSGGMLAMDAICKPRFRADEELRPEWGFRWRPPIHMPRWASRITLEITAARVERVHEIGKDGRKAHDVLAEGITEEQIEHQRKFFHADDSPALAYAALWESINGKGSWAINPWVWCISFKRVESLAQVQAKEVQRG